VFPAHDVVVFLQRDYDALKSVSPSADNRSACRVGLAIVLALLIHPPAAHADWLLSAYLGTSKTASNTVTIDPASGGTLEIGPISYESRAFTSPVYYGGRAIYFFPAMPWLGIGGEWTHNKAIADLDQLVSINGAAPGPLSRVLGRLELTNGLNFALADLAVRHPLAIGNTADRVSLIGYGGIGAALPHVETDFAGVTKYEYQLTGLGWQVGGGVEWRIVKGLSAISDLRLSSGRQRLDLGSGTLTGTFTSTQFDFGLAWHVGK
jgi:lipid A oxidase